MKKKIIFAIGIFAGLFMSFGGVGEQAFAVVYGCTDRNSWYYNSNATVDDGSCQYFYCSSHNFRTCYSSSCTCDNNTCQIQSDQEKFRERDYMYGSYVWGTCDGNYSGNDCSQYQGLPEVPYRSWYDCTTDHSSSQCSRPLSCGCKDPSAKNYTSNLSAQYTGSCHYCTAGSTDSACIVNFCGEVNDPLVLNAQTLAECSASNPDKTCVSSNNSCEYQPINFCGDVNSPLVANAMTSDQCRAANPGKTCIRDDDLCTYNPGCNDLPYPNVTGEGYECCRPGGSGVGADPQPCKVEGNQRCRDRDICIPDAFSMDDPQPLTCAPAADQVCAVSIVDQCIVGRANQCGETGDAWCGFSFDVQYTFLGVIYIVQIDTGYWYDPNVEACIEPDIQAILEDTLDPLSTPPPYAETPDGIPITPMIDQCPNIAGDQSYADFFTNEYTREANGDCGCPAGQRLDGASCVPMNCEEKRDAFQQDCYDSYTNTLNNVCTPLSYDACIANAISTRDQCQSDADSEYSVSSEACSDAYTNTSNNVCAPMFVDVSDYQGCVDWQSWVRDQCQLSAQDIYNFSLNDCDNAAIETHNNVCEPLVANNDGSFESCVADYENTRFQCQNVAVSEYVVSSSACEDAFTSGSDLYCAPMLDGITSYDACITNAISTRDQCQSDADSEHVASSEACDDAYTNTSNNVCESNNSSYNSCANNAYSVWNQCYYADAESEYATCINTVGTCGSDNGSTITPGTVQEGDVLPNACFIGDSSGVAYNNDTFSYDWTCSSANGTANCSALLGSCPDGSWCTEKDRCISFDESCADGLRDAGNWEVIPAHDGPVSLDELVVFPPIINAPGICNAKWDNAFYQYYTDGYSSEDPENMNDPNLITHCTLSNQDGEILSFDPGTTNTTIYSQSGVKKDMVYTLKCWDGPTEIDSVSTTGVCRINKKQGEFN